LDLAFAVCAVEMYVKDSFAPRRHVAADTAAASSASNLRERGSCHHLQQPKRYLDQLVVEAFVHPNRANHQHSIVTSDVSNGMFHQRIDRPFAGLGRAQLRDADLSRRVALPVSLLSESLTLLTRRSCHGLLGVVGTTCSAGHPESRNACSTSVSKNIPCGGSLG
jgi:hypothetical protein